MAIKKKSLMKFLVIACLFLGLVIAWLGFGERGFIHLSRMQKDRQAYLERIQKLKKENEELMAEIERLKNDEHYMESIARKELGLIKEDETLYRFSKERRIP